MTSGPLQDVSPGLPGGTSSAINVTTAQTIKPAPGICVTLSIIAPGSSGTLTLNDSATTGGADVANEFYSVPSSALTAGTVPPIIRLNWPCAAGITVSSMPTSAQIAVSFT